jgi:hypothetical protein
LKPTRSPSGQPSKQPVDSPSVQPTSQPLMKPSRKPIIKPSLQPTSRPTSSKPSSVPTSSPSKPPISSSPTKKGDTKKPIHNPTSMPTYNTNYYNQQSYLDFKNKEKQFTNKSNIILYSTLSYKNKILNNSCSNWNSLLDNKLSLPINNIIFTKININMDFTERMKTDLEDTVSSTETYIRLMHATFYHLFGLNILSQ